MIVSATINRTGPYDFLVDTGTQITTIYPSLAAELQLKRDRRLQVELRHGSRKEANEEDNAIDAQSRGPSI
jgi:hypothetical protein